MSLFSTNMVGAESCVGDEILEGVILERRQLLRFSLATLATLIIHLSPRGVAQQIGSEEPISWDELIEQAIPLAKSLVTGLSRDEEAHLIQMSGLMKRLNEVPRAFFDLSRPVATHESVREFPVLALQFRLAPGASIPYHDHRDYVGVLMVTSGDVRIRSFEMVGRDSRPPQGTRFQIRETNDSVLTKGAQSSLSRTRGNIHDLRAGPEGARFVDFFTLFREDAHSTYLSVADEPRDPLRRIFDATWA